MPNAASYFKDEAGIHLSLHLTQEQFTQLMVSLIDHGGPDTEAVYQMLYQSRQRDEQPKREPRFDEWAPSPEDGAL